MINHFNRILFVFLLLVMSTGCKADNMKSATDNILQTAESLFYEGKLDQADSLLSAEIDKLNSDESQQTFMLQMMVARGRILATNSFITNQGYEQALAVNNEATELAVSLSAELLESDALTYAGLASYARTFNSGNQVYDTALSLFQQAAAIRHKLSDQRGIAESDIYLGIIQERTGNIDSAKAYYKESLELSVEGGYKLEESYATRHLAFIRQREKDLPGALEYFKRSLTIREEIGFKVYLPFSYLSVGVIYDFMGDLDKALPYYQKSYEAAKEVDAPRAVILGALNIGETYKRQGDLTLSRTYYDEALSISKELNYSRGAEMASDALKELDSLETMSK